MGNMHSDVRLWRGNVANDIFAGLGLSGQRQTYLVISWIYSIGALCLQKLRFSSAISAKIACHG